MATLGSVSRHSVGDLTLYRFKFSSLATTDAYAVTNMPGAVPRTSTRALTLNTFPYVLEIADLGWKGAVKKNSALAKGINLVEGKITHQAVAGAFNLPYTPLEEVL